MIRWPCLCLVCWSHFQEFLKKAQTQKAGKKNKNKRFFLLSSLILPASSNKISRIQPPEGPHWFAGASERLPLWGARQCNREGLGNSHAGYLHW